MKDWLNKVAETWITVDVLITGILMILAILGLVAYALYLALTAH